VIGMIAIVRAGPYDRMAVSMNDRTLFIRSLPGYPGTRSDLYEVYMEPYYFVCICGFSDQYLRNFLIVNRKEEKSEKRN